MDVDFSLVLLIAVAITGLIWLFDAFVLAPPRKAQMHNYLQKQGLSEDAYLEYAKHQEQSEPDNESYNKRQVESFNQANKIGLEPVPVDFAKSIFPVILAVLVIRSFLFEPFQIPTGSMIPSLNIGDFIVVNKFSYGVRLPVIGTKIIDVSDPERGDVMVFIPPHDPTFYIKRVVGLPGDHVRYENKTVYINGEAMEQTFVATLQNGLSTVNYNTEQLGDVTHDIYTARGSYRSYEPDKHWLPPEGRIIPEGHYFMMGDNRDNSEDSRYWGPVTEDNIVGRAVAVWMQKEPGLNWPSFSENRLISP